MSNIDIDEITVTPSCGNVFEDLGLPEADERLAKADAALLIGKLIKSRGLTQTQAAAILGIDQPKVSALMCGKLSGFSMDRLLRFLTALGANVDVSVDLDTVKKQDSKVAPAHGRFQVHAYA